MLIQKSAASVGIIGGADGPTAIFLTGGSPLFFALLSGAAVLVLMILLIRRKRK